MAVARSVVTAEIPELPGCHVLHARLDQETRDIYKGHDDGEFAEAPGIELPAHQQQDESAQTYLARATDKLSRDVAPEYFGMGAFRDDSGFPQSTKWRL